MRTGSLYWKQGVGEYKNQKILIITVIIKTETDEGGRGLMVGQAGSGEGRVVTLCVCVHACVCLHVFVLCLQRCVCVCVSTLGGIERALTLCLYGPTVNGDKGPACGTAQPDDVTAHVPGQLGEAGGLQQEGLLGLHGGFGAAAVPHGDQVVGLARAVTP